MKVRVLSAKIESEAKPGENLLEVFNRSDVLIDVCCAGSAEKSKRV